MRSLQEAPYCSLRRACYIVAGRIFSPSTMISFTVLPDFPEVKQTVLNRLMGRRRLDAEANPLLAMMPPFIIHEGNLSIVRRENGTEVVLDLRGEPIKSSVALSVDDIRRRGPAASVDAVTRLADGLTEGLAKRTFTAIEEAAESVGNSINANGAFTPEVYFRMLERIELGFDASGKWSGLTILAHPDTAAKTDPVLQLIETDPELRARRDEIVEAKRKEWRVREAARQLVD